MYYKVCKNNRKTCWILKCDIRKFFASIDHEVLLGILKEYIPDQDIIWLLREIIQSFWRDRHATAQPNALVKKQSLAMDFTLNHCEEADFYQKELVWQPTKQSISKIGLPLGNLTSQLFVNIYMNQFDQFVKHKLKAKYYIRYADDFVILSTDRQQLMNQLTTMKEFLKKELKLSLHPNKIILKTFASGIDFLGWVNFPKNRVLRTATKRRMLKKVREKNLQSYLGLLKHGDSYKIRKELLNQYWLNET
jgi:hypothetical protein